MALLRAPRDQWRHLVNGEDKNHGVAKKTEVGQF